MVLKSLKTYILQVNENVLCYRINTVCNITIFNNMKYFNTSFSSSFSPSGLEFGNGAAVTAAIKEAAFGLSSTDEGEVTMPMRLDLLASPTLIKDLKLMGK